MLSKVAIDDGSHRDGSVDMSEVHELVSWVDEPLMRHAIRGHQRGDQRGHQWHNQWQSKAIGSYQSTPSLPHLLPRTLR